MLILIDQDGVLGDFDNASHAAWEALDHPQQALPPSEHRTFHVREDYPEPLRATVEEIYTLPGFFHDLPPIAGALNAFRNLLALGHDVRICTWPLNL